MKFNMNALGKYCHDFPRLAKESGYTFQLNRGTINWNDIEKVNIQEIIDGKNFRVLEQNLIHVINFNLDKDYDVKILDQNFVKLFKLAQLGIDYLSYCELYLDRCVLLLQEQLSAFQKEHALLKEEVEKKDEELKRSKKKIRMQYQKFKCNACDKIFINETYLESHANRRHKNTKEENKITRLCTDQAQQTEREKKSVSVLIQTDDNILLKEESTIKDTSELLKISEQELKIDNLKRDLEELKIRLNLAEKSMEQRKSDDRSFYNNFPSAVIPIIHSYIAPTNAYAQVGLSNSGMVPNVPNNISVLEEAKENAETMTNEINLNTVSEDIQTNKLSRLPIFRHTTENEHSGIPQKSNKTLNTEWIPQEITNITPIKHDIPVKSSVEDLPVHSDSGFSTEVHVTDMFCKSEEEVEVNKVTDIAKTDENAISKPIKTRNVLEIADTVSVHSESGFILGSSPVPSVSNFESPSRRLEPRTSTPIVSPPKIKETSHNWSTVDDTEFEIVKQERKSKSAETLVHEMTPFEDEKVAHEKSKSLLRKIVTKKSPKIRELKVNLKNSFTNIYNTVGKKDLNVQINGASGNAKTEIFQGLHSRLKDLGIDPEWSGIPKETMRQKLKILEHHRNMLSKENRLYPYIRRKLEKHILKKLKSNSLKLKLKTDTSLESIPQEGIAETSGTNDNKKTLNNTKNDIDEITIYDTDRESDIEEYKPEYTSLSLGEASRDTKIPHAETEAKRTPQRNENAANGRDSTDFSIFQVSRFKDSKPKVIELHDPGKPKLPNTTDELETDSDFDEELFKDFEEESIKMISKHMNSSPMGTVIASFPEKVDESPPAGNSSLRDNKLEGQSILKSESPNKTQLITKKKVFFADEPEIFETSSKHLVDHFNNSTKKQKIFDMTSVVNDDEDDDWSIESEWTVDNVTTSLKFNS